MVRLCCWMHRLWRRAHPAAFATAADDFGAWTFPTPDNLTSTTLVATVYWLGSEAACDNTDTSDDVCWTVAAAGIGDAGPFEGASLGTPLGVVGCQGSV